MAENLATRVVNIRKQTDRGAFIYVGRRCRHPAFGWLRAHYFANPFKVPAGATLDQKAECLERYRRWLLGTQVGQEGRAHLSALAQVAGHTRKPLGCWCGDWPEEPGLLCHAVVLAKEIDLILARSD